MTGLVPFLVVGIAEDDTVGGGKNVVAGASLNILKYGGGGASVFSDEAGSTPISLPTTLDSTGQKMIFIAPGSYDVVIAGTSRRQDIVGVSGGVITVGDYSELTTTPCKIGQIIYLAKNTIDGIGGGHFIGVSSSGLTADSGLISASATSGVYFKRINYTDISCEMFGFENVVDMPNTELIEFLDAGGIASKQIGIGGNFLEQIRLNERDVSLLVMGDSTGNANDEWAYLTAEYLAEKFPTHSVEYYLWNTTSYYSPVTISTGTGSNTIYVNNASIPGATAAYFLGSNRPAVYNSMIADMVIFSYGHNMGTAASYNQIFNYHVGAISEIIADNPTAECVVTVQNIDTEYPVYSGLQASALTNIASILGCGVIDVRSIFCKKFEQGDITDWMGDLIHPNSTGERVWASIVKGALENDVKMPCTPRNLMADSEENLIYNDHFYSWLWSDSLPIGYTLNSYATADYDYTNFETKGYSIELTSTGSSGQIGILSNDFSNQLSKINKKNGATFSARVRASSGSTANCGRVEVHTGGSAISSWPRTEPKGGWYWSSVYLTEAQLNAATSLTLSVYSGDTTDVVSVDRIQFNEGNLIKNSRFKQIEITELYRPSNVFQKTSNDVLVVTGDQVQCTNTVDAYPGFKINISDLEIGTSYTMTWTSAISAASSGVYVRSFGGGGSIQQSATPLNTNTITWTAIAQSASVQVEILAASALVTTFTVTDISIQKT